MTEEITGKPPRQEDVLWKTTILEMAKESISSIEESAKHLIAAASFLEGVYFHAISFADLKIMFSSVRYFDYHWLLVFLFLPADPPLVHGHWLRHNGSCNKSIYCSS